MGERAYWSGLTRPDKKGVIAGENLLQIVNHLKGTQLLPAPEAEVAGDRDGLPDLKDIRGQEEARLALKWRRRGT